MTGGMLASAIVDIPDLPAVFRRVLRRLFERKRKRKILGDQSGIVSLRNEVVSERIALEMAKGLKRKTDAPTS
ncbi:MAG: CinA family protein [Bacillus subtilis]|nr:CinA family protein [Bacillus subtilis]